MGLKIRKYACLTFPFLKIDFTFNYMYEGGVGLCTRMSMDMEARGSGSPGAEVTGVCELPSLGMLGSSAKGEFWTTEPSLQATPTQLLTSV